MRRDAQRAPGRRFLAGPPGFLRGDFDDVAQPAVSKGPNFGLLPPLLHAFLTEIDDARLPDHIEQVFHAIAPRRRGSSSVNVCTPNA